MRNDVLILYLVLLLLCIIIFINYICSLFFYFIMYIVFGSIISNFSFLLFKVLHLGFFGMNDVYCFTFLILGESSLFSFTTFEFSS